MKPTSFYLHRSVYLVGAVAVVLMILSYFTTVLFTLAQVILVCLAIAVLVDAFLLYGKKSGISAQRQTSERWSNGDDNEVEVIVQNQYGFSVRCRVIDEIPFQLGVPASRIITLSANDTKALSYSMRPVARGRYTYGHINLYAESPLHLIIRRYTVIQETQVKVYPAYQQLHRYELQALANRNPDRGVRRMRKMGNSMEFEQIKDYIRGDDYRTINWKATARRGDMMTNNFTEERSQQLYCLVNKGRMMKMTFEGMTLLDYAINAALALCNIAIKRHDKAGLMMFAEKVGAFVPAERKAAQLNTILEMLYNEQTTFLEPDYEQVFTFVRNRIPNRSLLVLFTHFESYVSFTRQLSFLKRLAHYHVLLVVFFENTAIKQLVPSSAKTVEDIYMQTIAEKIGYERKIIVKELQHFGILSLVVTPQHLTPQIINKYVELKYRQYS